MADNFDMKQFLTENKLGPYSRLKEEKFYAPSYVAKKYGSKAKEIEDNIQDEEDNNPNIWDLYTSLETPEETDEFVAGYIDEAKVKEDLGGDIGDAQAEKMMDFLAEEPDQAKVQDMYDKITAVMAKAAKKLSDDEASALHDKLKAFFNKLFESTTINEAQTQDPLMLVDKVEGIIKNLNNNITTNSNISTTDKVGLLQALKELQELIEDIGFYIEIDQDENLNEESVRMFKSDNPEGDKLVLDFLKRIAKDFDYPVQQAALFVKERIKKLGY